MTDHTHIEGLLARLALRDRAAFAEIYRLTSAKLFAVCLRVLKDQGEAEEVLQESFVKIWRAADRYQSNGLSPMTWLITIARNSAIDRLRRRMSRPEQSVDVTRLVFADPAPGPEARAIAGSETGQIMSCFGELEPSRAEAVRLAYLDGETYEALAARFDVPLNTMRTWLRRSLLKLKECLSR
ncbi:sigma-70 family RNA polymerase sigma factor [Roseovarius sp. C7]|uniref:sigma-70 family RNA polymerase sigma factor n=1 Tax=Roseovarius sp. C7 TaxID=3398643 RepID=UPI0039F6C924